MTCCAKDAAGEELDVVVSITAGLGNISIARRGGGTYHLFRCENKYILREDGWFTFTALCADGRFTYDPSEDDWRKRLWDVRDVAVRAMSGAGDLFADKPPYAGIMCLLLLPFWSHTSRFVEIVVRGKKGRVGLLYRGCVAFLACLGSNGPSWYVDALLVEQLTSHPDWQKLRNDYADFAARKVGEFVEATHKAAERVGWTLDTGKGIIMGKLLSLHQSRG